MAGSQRSIKEELEEIRNFLELHKGAASIGEIEAAVDIERRTLQRRLEKLREEGFIALSGQGRATRYYPITNNIEHEGRAQTETGSIPLTRNSKKIISLVTRPTHLRKPIGYNQDFLASYRPNVDFYLAATEMEKLAELGNTSKTDHPAGTYAREILHRLLIDLSWNSSRLEGNTYSLLDTERLIAVGEIADDKSATEAQMILNHKDAIEFIVQSADDIGFNRYTVLNLHAMLSNNLLYNSSASGKLREIGVTIGQSTYMPLEIPQQIEEMFELLLAKADQINNPFEQAFFAMVHLPYLQPFEDVNKRVSRLAANIPLNKHNLAPLSFVDVPKDIYTQGLLGIYEFNRVELLKDVFMWAYERSAARYAVIRQILGDPDPFRLKYRAAIKEVVTEVVSRALLKKEASALVKEKAKSLPESDQSKFIEAVEMELLSLHEGNFARYWIRPAEFRHWKEMWEK